MLGLHVMLLHIYVWYDCKIKQSIVILLFVALGLWVYNRSTLYIHHVVMESEVLHVGLQILAQLTAKSWSCTFVKQIEKQFETCVWHVVMDCKVFCMGKYCVMQHHVCVSWLNKDLDMDCKVLFGFFHVYTGDICAHVNVKFWFSMLMASLKAWFKSSDLLEQLAAGVDNQASNVFATLVF